MCSLTPSGSHCYTPVTTGASFGDDTIPWYENTLGDGSSLTPHTLTTDVDVATSVYATDADVDGDGDIDALSSSLGDNKTGLVREHDSLPLRRYA